eukprot:jgi/Ulvmu1/8433/UM043_0011.1
MVISYLRGLSNESELNRIIAKLLKLDAKPVSKLAQSRWILSEGVISRLLKTARKALKAEPALLRDIPAPCIVVGDLHGDILTLIRILKHNGMPPKATYMFLGDYVDRGSNGVEVLALILALRCRWPGHVHCLRGNHESIMMSRAYGYLSECRTRYSTRIYSASIAVFNVLPIAAVVGGSVFAVHGGITPRLRSLADIDAIARPAKLEADTLLADLIWGDPVVNTDVQDYADSDRGAGHLFGQRAYDSFLARHGFTAMVRAHEVCRRGCRRSFGTCWTVFSHPQYLGLQNAAGALVIHAGAAFEPQTFAATPEDLEALRRHPLDAEEEEALEAVPRCMESVMLDAVDSTERAAIMAELDSEILGLQVGSTSTNGSEQFETGGADGVMSQTMSQTSDSVHSAATPLRTPANADVHTHGDVAAIGGAAAAPPVGTTLPPPPRATPAATLPAPLLAAAGSPAAACGSPSEPSPLRRPMPDAGSGGGAARDMARPASAPVSRDGSQAVLRYGSALPPASPAVAIRPSPAATIAAAAAAAGPQGDVQELSGSPASVAYALAGRAGLPAALVRPLTASGGHASGKAFSSSVAEGRTAPIGAARGRYLPPLASSPAASQPLILAIGSRTDLSSPLQTSAPPSRTTPTSAPASGASLDADHRAPSPCFVPPAAAGVCQPSSPESPDGASPDELPALPEGQAVSNPAEALLKPPPDGPGGGLRAVSGSADDSDSAGMGRDISMNVSATTLAAISGITDEQDSAAC